MNKKLAAGIITHRGRPIGCDRGAAVSATKLVRAVVLGAVLALGAGCGGPDTEPKGAGGAVPGPNGGDERKVEEVCELLTDAEITEAIGEHDAGRYDPDLSACVWLANSPDQGAFTEAIVVTLVSEDDHRNRVKAKPGDPIEGFGEGATYSPMHGELWFRCGDQWCSVQAAGLDGDRRKQVVHRLARSLDGRR